MGKIFLQINSAAVAFIDILIAAWEGLMFLVCTNTIRATNEMSEKNAGSYLHFSINT